MHFTSTVLAAGLLAGFAIAHPGPHEPISGKELVRKSGMSKRCASAAANLNNKRYERRMMKKKRDLEARWEGGGNATFEITTEAPYYEVIHNDTCVLTPEVTEGPYVWPRSQTLRQDMIEGQPGVPLWLDVGVLDMNTCEPLPNVLVDFWHCNATGSYSSFEALSPNTAFPTVLEELNITDFDIGTTDIHTGNSTWLRGMWPTDSNGVMEMKTIFPGFYTERAIHIHVQVHKDWVVRGNGTLAAGNTVSTGQVYFEEDLAEKIMALEPYVSHTQINRTTLADDTVFEQDTVGGYNPILSVVPADGENVENGMIGYITIGVDLTAVETDE